MTSIYKTARGCLIGLLGSSIHQSRFHRQLVENGISPPWIFTPDECLEYWRIQVNTIGGNRPRDYATKDMGIMALLHEFISPEINSHDSIMELGCNSGANLNYLFGRGFKWLAGIEINPNAIAQIRERFPIRLVTYEGSIEEWLPILPHDLVDVIFTMATLEHIHPKSNFIFGEMIRVAKKYIVTVEKEKGGCAYLFPRDYRRVFEKLGCTQIKSQRISILDHPYISESYDGYMMRMFQVGEMSDPLTNKPKRY